MITENKTTWTDPMESMALHEYFFDKYGKDVASPMCEFCKKCTCYIVEDAKIVVDNDGMILSIRPARKGVAMLNRLSHSRTLVKGAKIYIPILKCEDCSARLSAMEGFKNGIHKSGNLNDLCMTSHEKKRYQYLFELKICDLRKELEEKIAKNVVKYRI